MKKLLLTSATVLSLATVAVPAAVSAQSLADFNIPSSAINIGALSTTEITQLISELSAALTSESAKYDPTREAAEAADKAYDAAVATKAEADAKVEELTKSLAAAKEDVVVKTEAFKKAQEAVQAFVKAYDEKEAALSAEYKAIVEAQASLVKAAEEKAVNDVAAAQATVDALVAEVAEVAEELAKATATEGYPATELEAVKAKVLDAQTRLDAAQVNLAAVQNEAANAVAAARKTQEDTVSAAKVQLDLNLKNLVNTLLENDKYNQNSPAEDIHAVAQKAQEAKAAAEGEVARLDAELTTAKAEADAARKALTNARIEHQAALSNHKTVVANITNTTNKLARLALRPEIDLETVVKDLNADLRKSVIDATGKSEAQLDAEDKKATEDAAAAKKALEELEKEVNKGSETTKSGETTKASETTKAAATTAAPATTAAKKSEDKKALPNTGEATTFAGLAAAALALVGGAFAVLPRFKKEQ